MSGYIWLSIAIIMETIGSTCLKLSHGMTKIYPTIGLAISFAICFWSLTQALKTLPLGTSYAIWAGIGLLLTKIMGILVFDEKLTLASIIGAGLIISGVVVLHVFDGGHTSA